MDTKNLTIFFSDMVSFTKVSSSLSREQIFQLIESQDQIIAPTIKEYKGKIIKTIGDAYLATFQSSTNALLCAIKIQEQLYSQNQAVPKKDRFKVRIALNCGDVTLKDKDVFGTPVNVASRVQSLAKPGEIYITEALYLSLNRSEIPFIKVGKKTLKGIPRQIELYKVDMKGRPSFKKRYFISGMVFGLVLLLCLIYFLPIVFKDNPKVSIFQSGKDKIKSIVITVKSKIAP